MTRAMLAFVLAFALLVRGVEVDRGLPLVLDASEACVVGSAQEVLRTGNLNTHPAPCGPAAIEVAVAVSVVHTFFLITRPPGSPGHLSNLRALEDDHPLSPKYPSYNVWLRWVMVVVGCATVAVTWRLGRDLGGPVAGIVAATALAVWPAHIRASATAGDEALATLLVTSVAALSLVHARTRDTSALVWASVLVGLALSTRVGTGWCWILPIAALLWGRRSLWPAVVGLPVAAFLLTSPFSLFDLPGFIDGIAASLHAGRAGSRLAVWPLTFAVFGALLARRA